MIVGYLLIDIRCTLILYISKVNIVIQNKFNGNDINYNSFQQNDSEPLFSILVYEIKTSMYKSHLLLVLTNVN